MTEDLDRQLRLLLYPSGDAGAQRARGEALQALLEQADEAHPRLLALAQAEPPSLQAMLALPRFGRPESVPVLEHVLLTADGPTTAVAAGALADHPAPAALVALESALGSDRPQVVLSAVMGLGERADAHACGPLAAALEHSDSEIRERIAHVRDRLGCGE